MQVMKSTRVILLCVLLTTLDAGCRHVTPLPLSPESSAVALGTRSLDDPDLRDFMADQLGHLPEPWPKTRWNLRDLTLAGLFFQPEMRVAAAVANVAEARIGAISQLPNPTLSLFPQRLSNPATGISPWLAVAQIDWTFETAGKRRLRRAAAQARAGAAKLAISVAAWRLRGRLAKAILTLEAAKVRRTVRIEAREAQARLVAMLEARLRVGAADQSSIALQRLALTGMRADAARAHRLELEAKAGLASVLGLPVAALEAVEISFALGVIPKDLAELESAEARRAALLGRADVLAMLSTYAAAEADLRLELAKQFPDLHIGPAYEFDQGSNKWGLALSLELPLLSQNQGAIDEALARRSEVATRFEALQSQVVAEVESALASLRGSRVELSEAHSLLEGARQRRNLAGAAFAAGAADRVTLLNADLEIQRATAVLIDSEEQLQNAAARLEQAVQPPRAFEYADPRDTSAESAAQELP